MNTFITTDYETWDNTRDRSFENKILLSVPPSIIKQFKGFALKQTIIVDGVEEVCRVRVLPKNDSLKNYDFSNCYLFDYFMTIGDSVPLDENYAPNFNEKWQFVSSVYVNYMGEAVPNE